ncbi:MAG: hypothetical protein OXG33_08695 [Chloroflexi bacterium]|nr:hypothetical protein [Chloroflexota bacterium]
MPHVLTRARAVVGGGIVAVLLLACLGARLGAQDPIDPVPGSRLPITLPTAQRLAVALGIPLVIAGVVALWRTFRVHRSS